MSLTDDKLAEFEALGIGGAVIANIQEHNVELSKQADEMELERKQEDDVPPTETPPVEPVPPVETPLETPSAPAEEAAPEKPIETPAEIPPVEETPAEEAPVEEVVEEVPAPSETPVALEPVPDSVPEPAAETPVFSEGQTKELASVLTSVATNIIETLEKKMDEKLAPLLEVRSEKTNFLEDVLSQTPTASRESWEHQLLDPIINGTILRKESAIGQAETEVDGRSALAKDTPAENKEEEAIMQSGNLFNDMIATDLATGRVLDPLLEKEPV